METPLAARVRANSTAIGLALALGPLVGQGFARFAYALLLPPMRDTLKLSYAQCGGLNGANAAGYLLGSLLAAAVARLFGIRNGFLAGMLLTGIFILGTGLTGNYQFLLAMRFGSGVSAAIAYIVGSALAAELPPRDGAAFFAGPGAGIFLSGLVVPAVLVGGNASHWQLGWIVMGIVALLAWLPAWKASGFVSPHSLAPVRGLSMDEFLAIWPTWLNYTLFGAGYAGYMTFVIALLRNQGFPAWVPVAFWLVLGFMATVSVFAWRTTLEKMPGGWGPGLMSVILFFGSVPLLVHPSVPMAAISAVLFGGTFMCVVSAVLVVARRVLPVEAWTGVMALLTVGFALGQTAGPILSGWVSDMTGSLSAGLWTAPAILLVAAVVALLQPRVLEQTASAGRAPIAEAEG